MNEEVKTEIKKVEVPFTLPNRKVKVVPIKRQGVWLNSIHPDHEAGFLVANAGKKYMAPLASKDRIANPLTKEEQTYLEKVIARDLNPYNKVEDNYWNSYYVRLNREMKILDLSVPEDFIAYKVLLLQPTIVLGAENKFGGDYKYFIADVDYDEKSGSKTANSKKEAWKLFGKLTSDGKTAIADFLTVYYQGKPGSKVPQGAKVEWLESELMNIIENDREGFLSIGIDPEYRNKVLITKAMRSRAIVLDEGIYHLAEGDVIAKNISDLILWIKDGANSGALQQIKARIEANER